MNQTVTVAGMGNSNPILLNLNAKPPIGLLVNVPAGVTFAGKVQVAGDPAGPWNDHDTLTNLTGSANGNIQFPVGAVRLSASACSGGTVSLSVIQSNN